MPSVYQFRQAAFSISALLTHARDSCEPRASGLCQAYFSAFGPKRMIRLRFSADTSGF